MSAISPALNEMEDKISKYSKFLDIVPDKERQNLQSKLLSVKLMKEQLVATTAIARAQSILAQMEVLVAKNNLKTAFEQLVKYKNEYCDKEKKSSQHELTQTKPTKELKSFETKVTSPMEMDKKNTTKMTVTEVPKSNKSRSHTPTEHTEESNKRKHSSSKHNEKKAKKSRKSDKNSTLTETMISPIHKRKRVQTGWFEQSDSLIENSRPTADEETMFLEDLTKPAHEINLTEASQKILPSDPDLTQGRKMQVVLEDVLKEKKKSRKVEDPLDISTDDLVNGLFKDIMEAKLKEASSGTSSSSLERSSPSVTCKFMLRQLLDCC